MAVYVGESTTASFAEFIQHVYLSCPRPHRPDKCKLEVGIAPSLDPFLELVSAYVVQIVGSAAVGEAPKGEMERQMIKLINDLQKMTI